MNICGDGDARKPMSRETSLASLRERVRRLERPVRRDIVPLGLDAIDRELPGGGLARGAVHEILGHGADEEDGALAAAFAATLAARLGATGPVLWCLRRPDLHGPGLLAAGLDPARLVLALCGNDAAILWAMEEGLRTRGMAAIVGEVGRLPPVAGRRLQLAAERAGVPALVLRRWWEGGEAAGERLRPSAAATRWRVATLPARSPPDRPAIGRPRWRLTLLRCRGGGPGSWDVEVIDATGALALSAALADRPAAPIGADDRRQDRRRAG
jgi:protein ImuA